DGRVAFTSYKPGGDGASANLCAVRIGTSYLYSLNLVTGKPVSINTGNANTNRRTELAQDVPPPSPTLLSDGDKVHVVIGTEVVG
ncbi:hypothetical protein ACXWO5_10365, partial [Streptococcus pyogenes]